MPKSTAIAPRAGPTDQAVPVDIASIYRAHAADVARWAARLGGPGIETDDIVQEVFLIAKRRLREFRSEGGKISTWLFRTTEKIVLAARRKQRVRRWLQQAPESWHPGPAVSGLAPGEALERQQEIASVYAVLDQLPERQRRLLVLFELEGLGTQAIADLTNVRLGTVRVQLHRARSRFIQEYERLVLRRQADEQEQDPDDQA